MVDPGADLCPVDCELIKRFRGVVVLEPWTDGLVRVLVLIMDTWRSKRHRASQVCLTLSSREEREHGENMAQCKICVFRILAIVYST